MMEGEIGSGDCAAVRWDDFRSDGFSTAQLQVGLKVLAYLGFVTVELDGRRNLYRKSEDWRRLDILIKA
jgi:DNA-binding transcriptional ArsR family regulator